MAAIPTVAEIRQVDLKVSSNIRQSRY